MQIVRERPGGDRAAGRRSPFGNLIVDTAACTLCLACVGACPEAALADNADRPQLRFIEKNCVQCGLCASTCPEDAITAASRACCSPTAARRERRRGCCNEAEPFCCVRCGKPFGTPAGDRADGRQARRAMPMFQGAAAQRA